MKALIAALTASIVLMALFFIGVSAQMPLLLVTAACAWTPAAWWLGWAFAKVNGRFRSPVSMDTSAIGRPPKRRASSAEFN